MLLGWLKRKMKPNEETPEDTHKRVRKVTDRISRAERTIDRSERLLRASGYYNDRLEGTRLHGRTN